MRHLVAYVRPTAFARCAALGRDVHDNLTSMEIESLLA